MKSEQPQEFIIVDENKGINGRVDFDGKNSEWFYARVFIKDEIGSSAGGIVVVEKSAFDSLAKQVEQLKAELEETSDKQFWEDKYFEEFAQHVDTKEKLAIATAALEQFAKQDNSSNMFIVDYVSPSVACEALAKLKASEQGDGE